MIPVSYLSNYLYCPRKLFLEAVLKFEIITTEQLLKGKIKHDIYQELNKAEENIVKSIQTADYNEIFSKYRVEYSRIVRNKILENKIALNKLKKEMPDLFQKIWGSVLREINERSENVFEFIQIHKVLGKELWKKLTPKIMTEVELESKELELRGVSDKIELFEDQIKPFEVKTGKAPDKGIWPGDKMQLFSYMLLAAEKFSKEVKSGCVFYVEKHEKRELLMSPFVKDEVTMLKDKVKAILENENLPDYVDNKNKCESCVQKEKCYNESFMELKMKELKEGKQTTL